ncbi:MAG: nitrilase-related carbon-nitrogen hydrolase, partial [SAR324 cluster bacterium]|nr:nitrilase-related carbon-nitrogen hydrolase [SAR324 cluster bacterium]
EKHQTSILLASIDWEMGKTGPRFFGISVMVGPNGKIIGRYNKIFLIPFGETLPFSEWFPEIAEWLRKEIRNMSEFEKGTEYTVFQLNPELQVSASICFDIFSTEIVRNMTRNGAGFVANLSNLAWFGKTTATHSMEAFVRWRAIENRVPILFASNNGSSVLIGPDGQPLSPHLGLFKTGFMGETVSIGSHYSFYREHSEIVRITFILLMLVSGWFAIRQRRKQKDDSG